MNYSIVHFLKQRLLSSMKVFEYGSGYSTLFFSERVAFVDSVEYDKRWVERIMSIAPKNVFITYCKIDVDGEYCRIIHKANRQYDIVIVDGRDRLNCLEQAVKALSPSGVIILDDSHRERYRSGIQLLNDHGFRSIDFEGPVALKHNLARSTVFYRNENCLNI